MKKYFVLLALIMSGSLAHAQILISDFSNLSSQALAFNSTWQGGTPSAPQYIQNSGNVSITPVNGGNPDGEGNLYATIESPGSVVGIMTLQLTAQLNTGNADSEIIVSVEDNTFTTIGTATFFTSSFNSSSFSTANATFNISGGGDATDATYFILAGDGVSGDAVRVSLDNLDGTSGAVPEPSSFLLLGIGFAGLGLYYCRRSLRVAA